MRIRGCKSPFLISLFIVSIACFILNLLNLPREAFTFETGRETVVTQGISNNSPIKSFIGTRWEANGKCLSFEEGMDNINDLISNSKQIFVIMPPKAGGSSMKQFTYSCMNTPNRRNWIRVPDKAKQNLMRKYKMDRVIAAHLNKNTLRDLSEHTSRGTLIIYMHREGTDRLLSAVKQVALDLCRFRLSGPKQKFDRNKPPDMSNPLYAAPVNETHCVLNEGLFIDIIETKMYEIGNGPDDTLTCDAYEAIEQNLPNFVFLHYTQQNKLQNLFAKHYCPDQEKKHILENVSSKRIGRKLFIKLDNDGEEHPISEWVIEKGNMIEWSLKMKGNRCQHKTRRIEDAMFACKDEIYQISEP